MSRVAIPNIQGGDFIELTAVSVRPLATPGQQIAFDELIVFSHDVIAMRATTLTTVDS